MRKYSEQSRFLLAVDCIIFGYDGEELKLLVIKRGFNPMKGKWSLVGGFVGEDESTDEAALRVLTTLTGLSGMYLEQLHTFSEVKRDSQERTISVAYFALINLKEYKRQLSDHYHPHWVSINQIPELIFDHDKMVEMAKKHLRYKSALHPLLFELLPQKFTLPQLQYLYESVYNRSFDSGNFSRKINSTKLLVKLDEKDRSGSKKGAYYYKVNMKKYNANFNSFLHFVNKPHDLVRAD
ncbi:MAG: NUDIX domain-containing protein [Chitinophagaceae bacterium]